MAELVHAGFGHYIAVADILALANMHPGSAPIVSRVREAKRDGRVLDLTAGRRTKTAVFTRSGAVVLTAHTAASLAGRVRAATLGEDE